MGPWISWLVAVAIKPTQEKTSEIRGIARTIVAPFVTVTDWSTSEMQTPFNVVLPFALWYRARLRNVRRLTHTAEPDAVDLTCVALLRPFRACGIGQRAPRATLRSALGWYVMPLRGVLMRTFHGRGWRCFGSMVRTQGGASLSLPCPGLICFAPLRSDANISRTYHGRGWRCVGLMVRTQGGATRLRRFAPWLLSYMPNGHEQISPGQGKESVAIFDAALGAYPHKNKSPERAKPGALDWTCVALLRPFRACGIGQRAPRAALRSALG